MTAALVLLAVSLAGDPKLTAADAKYLDRLLAECLFDPTGAERVRGEFPAHSPWGGSGTVTREGWLVRGKKGQPGRVFFADGFSLPAPVEFTGVNFVADCKERYAPKPKTDNERDAVFEQMRRNARGVLGDADLTLAAWLHRLGHADLAATALAAARKEAAGFAQRRRDEAAPDPRDLLRDDLAWEAYAGLVHAYANRADETALDHGNHFFKRYPDFFVRNHRQYDQAERIVGELNRRKREGRFGPAANGLGPNALPADPTKKVAALLAALDEVDARQHGQPGGVDLGDDWRVQALIEIGEPAIPALLNAFETDTRLTRSVHFWRDFSRHRTVLSVREAQLVAIMSILRVRVFEPVATGDNFTSRGEENAKETAAALRRYWNTYGKLPFDERMMTILADPKGTPAAWQEAAINLARLGDRRTIGTTVWSGGWLAGPGGKPNPAVAKFSNPTAAEAVLAALDRELKSIAGGDKTADEKERLATGAENVYLVALVELGDRRAGAELARRADRADSLTARGRFARAALRLDQGKPMEGLAKAFEAGSLPADGLGGLVYALIAAGTPAADRALFALVDPKHPYHKAAAAAIVGRRGWDDLFWVGHPYCLGLLRRALDNTTETGGVYSIEGNAVRYQEAGGGGWSRAGIPDELNDPVVRKAQARERACDAAAGQVAKLLAGAPGFHPLRKDADAAIRAMKETLDRFGTRFRRLGDEEQGALGLSSFEPSYAPDIKPLGKGATADDVAAGRAVFHLSGKGQPVAVRLPALVTLHKDADGNATRGLAVQAELGPDGAIVYGVLFRQGTRAVPASEVDKVEPVGK